MLRIPTLLPFLSLATALTAQPPGPGQSRTETNALGQTIVVTAASEFRITPPAREWPVIRDEDLPLSERKEMEDERETHGVQNSDALPVDGDPALQNEPSWRKVRSPLI